MDKAFIFDFDDTLAETECKVIVRADADDQIVARLSPKQYNTHKLRFDCHYDYSDFRDGSFIKHASPTWLIHLAKEVSAEGHNVFILTAREHKVIGEIEEWLSDQDVDITASYCVGGTSSQIAERKKRVLLDIVKKYDKIYFYDDSEENVNIFQHEKLRSYLV
jgi:hypothetical protein